VTSRRVWQPFSNMGADELTLTIVGGDRATLWDDEGRAYLHATAGLWYCNVGHGRTEIAEAGRAAEASNGTPSRDRGPGRKGSRRLGRDRPPRDPGW
jgi:acetylornithine/succinyldiaminopimelate/putrescine aminotransferase